MSIDYHMGEEQTYHDSFCGCQECKDVILITTLPQLLKKATKATNIAFLRKEIKELEARLKVRANTRPNNVHASV